MKFWCEAIAITQRILIELLRRRRSLIFWIIFPISILLINGFVLAESMQLSTEEGFAYAAPSTLVGAVLFFSCLGGSVATVVSEREQQTLKRLFISPLSGTSYFLGIFLAHSCIGFGQTLIIYTIAAFWGTTFKGSVFLGAIIILMSIVAYVGLGFILGTQLARRTEDVNSLVAAFGVPLLILGGAFFPIRFLPKTLLELAKINPIYHMNQALLAVSTQGENLQDIASHFQFLSGFTLIMILGGWFSYRRMVMLEKRL